MRILYYNQQLGCFDGSNSHAMGMLKALRKIHGEENVVVANHVAEGAAYSHEAESLKKKLGPALDPLKVLRRKKLSSSDASYAISTVREVGFLPDVLLARSPLYDEAPIRISEELGCKLILEANTPLFYECCDVRRTAMRPLVHAYEKKMIRASSGIYCVTDEVRDMLEEEYGGVREKAFVVPNGYDADLFSGSSEKESIRESIRTAEGATGSFIVTFIGSLQEWHGIPRLLEIAQMMHDKHPKVLFWVLGDGPERDSVRAYADSHRNLKWFGNVKPERMKELLYASDLGIMPYNGLKHFYFSPLKMYDMIGAGLPFVGYGIGQIAWLARKAGLSSAFLVNSLSAKDYADAIANIANDQKTLYEMRDEISNVMAFCTWDNRAKLLSNCIEGKI